MRSFECGKVVTKNLSSVDLRRKAGFDLCLGGEVGEGGSESGGGYEIIGEAASGGCRSGGVKVTKF